MAQEEHLQRTWVCSLSSLHWYQAMWTHGQERMDGHKHRHTLKGREGVGVKQAPR